MILSYRRGKTKATCECGSQVPKMADEAFAEWKRSDEGKQWFAVHRPHGKARAVESGGRVESLEDSLKKIEDKRTRPSKAELEDLVEKFNPFDGR